MSWSIGAEVSPVSAPSSPSCMFCATIFSADPFAASMQTSSDVNGAQIPMSRSSPSISGSSSSTYVRASDRSLCIFQLPATYGRRSGIVEHLHAGQAFAFEHLQRRAAARRQVVHAFGQSELVQGGAGVAAADDGRS